MVHIYKKARFGRGSGFLIFWHLPILEKTTFTFFMEDVEKEEMFKQSELLKNLSQEIRHLARITKTHDISH
jgi:hypothetical protein